MKLLAIIAFTFVLTLLATKLVAGNVNFLSAGNLGMSVFLLFTGFAHFKFQNGMSYLYTERVPMQIILILWTWFFGIYLH